MFLRSTIWLYVGKRATRRRLRRKVIQARAFRHLTSPSGTSDRSAAASCSVFVHRGGLRGQPDVGFVVIRDMTVCCSRCGRTLAADEAIWRISGPRGLGRVSVGRESSIRCSSCTPDRHKSERELHPCLQCQRRVGILPGLPSLRLEATSRLVAGSLHLLGRTGARRTLGRSMTGQVWDCPDDGCVTSRNASELAACSRCCAFRPR